MSFLLYFIPWWVYAIIALIAVGLVWKFFGWRWVLPAIVALGSGIALTRQRQLGYSDRKEEESKVVENTTKEFQEIHNENVARPDTELDNINAPWLRDNARPRSKH